MTGVFSLSIASYSDLRQLEQRNLQESTHSPRHYASVARMASNAARAGEFGAMARKAASFWQEA